MAATVSSPWAKPGAWALDAEEHEAELEQQRKEEVVAEPLPDFPSLASAAATKTKKKNKGQTLSLAEFNSGKASQPQRLTHEDLAVLPTGPRQRSAEELDRSRLGGGFKNYGSNRYSNSFGPRGDGDDSSNSRWGSSRTSSRDSSRELQPSRADEIDNWASAKKTLTAPRERTGFFDSHSKADESDSWVSKKTEPPRRSGFGSGFDRKSSFDSLSRDRERGDTLNSDNWGRRKEETSDSTRARPKLVLQPRTAPVSPVSDGPVNAVKPKGVNPFGEARPREAVLAEKGKDWKEIDEKLEAVKIKPEKERPETVSFGKRGFGIGGNGAPEHRSWRKSVSASVDAAASPRFASD